MDRLPLRGKLVGVSLAEADIIPASIAAYVRTARRLRAQHYRDPGRLHRSLQAMSGLIPVIDTAEGRLSGNIHVRSGRAADFAAMVGVELEAGILRYSSRQKLLVAAGAMGIERFEANLLIAAVQHTSGGKATLAMPKAPVGAQLPRRGTFRCTFLPTAVAVAVVQAAIIAGVWWILAA